MEKPALGVVLSVVIIGLVTTSAAAQEFQKSYSIGAGGRISVRGVSGDVNVTGYDGSAIVISGFKEGRDRDLVEVEDLSDGNSVDVRARYPRNCNCDASIRFQVQVPRSIKYNFDHISTASGNVEVSGVTGDLHVKTASGDVRVSDVAGSINVAVASGDVDVKNAAGLASARTASGNVTVEITRLEGADGMEFSSASGNVHVKVPASLDADVEMSTLSGALKTDFPLQIEERHRGPGRRATGRLGSGSRRLRLSSVSGDVSLIRY